MAVSMTRDNLEMDNIGISIIIPAYNVEQYIGAAIDSLLQQTVLPYEIIVINDGSSDNTRKVIENYIQFPFLKVIDKKNEGLGPTRNLGLSYATGDYIYFFDSDDLLHESFIEKLQNTILHNHFPDLILFAGTSFADGYSDAHRIFDYKRKDLGLLKKCDYPNKLLLASDTYHASACLYISKKKLWFDNNLFFKNIIHEDEELIFRLISSANTVFVTSEVFFFRRIRPGSIMTSGRDFKNLEGYQTIINSLLDYYATRRSEEHFDNFAHKKRLQFIFRQYVLLARALNKEKYFYESLRFILSAKIPSLFIILLYMHLPSRLQLKIHTIATVLVKRTFSLS